MQGTQKELPSDQADFVTLWLETRLGTLYQLPDMLPQHLDQVLRQLHEKRFSEITARNISGVVMVIPKRIIAKAGSGERCFWEAE